MFIRGAGSLSVRVWKTGYSSGPLRRLSSAATLARPVPNRSNVAGSGTAETLPLNVNWPTPPAGPVSVAWPEVIVGAPT
jgi:hypothetical protein